MPDLLSIGQFAKLCHTTTDTLIHYDDIGLFSPVTFSAQHRRRYHISQCYTFKTIQFLADSGITLTDIRQMLTDHSEPSLSVILQKHLEELEERKQYLESTIQHIEECETVLSEYGTKVCKQPFTLTHSSPKKLFATLSQSQILSSKNISQSLEYHIDLCTHNHVYPFPFGFYIKKQSLRAQDNQSLLIFSPFPHGTENNRTLIRPTGDYAALIHKGSINTLKHSIHQLREYISANSNYMPGDTFITCYDNYASDVQEAYYLIQTHMVLLTRS